jgi:hypothetical protein
VLLVVSFVRKKKEIGARGSGGCVGLRLALGGDKKREKGNVVLWCISRDLCSNKTTKKRSVSTPRER